MNKNDVIQIDYSAFQDSFAIDLSVYDEDFLLKVIYSRMVVSGCADTLQYHSYLWEHPEEQKFLKSSLNNSYSEFFRETLSFSILKNQILPQILKQYKGNKVFRIWSAGCALGQEAYSLAMLFNEALQHTSLSFRVLATDISSENLALAKAATYSDENMQKIPYGWWRRYFEPISSSSVRNPRSLIVEYRITKDIREKVDFALFDLNDKRFSSPPDGIFGDFDLVMCSNLLFYYNNEARKSIVRKLLRSLAPGGILITGEAERDIFLGVKQLKPLGVPSSVFVNES